MKAVMGMIVLVAMTLGMTTTAAAEENRSAAFGHIHYELRDSVATRDVSIRGEEAADGSMQFILNMGRSELRSVDAFMETKRDGKIAYVAFANAFNGRGDTIHFLFKGLKLQGDNKMIYQGKVLKISESDLQNNNETLAESIQRIKDTGEIDEAWKISGAFQFKKHL